MKSIYLFGKLVDMRRNFEGLRSIVESLFEYEKLKSNKYVFISLSRKIIKVLEYQENGWAILMRKLDTGTFKNKQDESKFFLISERELKELLD